MKIDPKIDSRSARAVSNEKPRKSTPKSTKNRRKLTLGASRARLLALLGRSKRPGRATRSDSGRLGRLGERLGATKSVEVGRSGSVVSARVGQVARPPPKPLAVIRIEIIIFIPQQGLPLGSVLFLKNWWVRHGPPGSATRVLSAGAQRRSAPLSAEVPQGSLRFLFRFPLGFPKGSAKFRRFREGSARFPKVS